MVFQQFCFPYHRQSTPRGLPDDAWSEIVVRRNRPALQRSRSSFLSGTTKISLQLRGQLDNDLARNFKAFERSAKSLGRATKSSYFSNMCAKYAPSKHLREVLKV